MGEDRASKKVVLVFSWGRREYTACNLLQHNPKCKTGVSRLVQSFLEPKIFISSAFSNAKRRKGVIKDQNKEKYFSSRQENFRVFKKNYLKLHFFHQKKK